MKKRKIIHRLRLILTLTILVCLLGACHTKEEEELTLTYTFVPDKSGAHMFDIMEMDSDSDGYQNEVLLKATNVGFNQADWNGDGTRMAMWGWHNPKCISIYTYSTNTGVLNRLTEQNNVYDMFPHWNSTDTKIVFTRQYLLENDRNEIWTMNADGSDAKKIVDGYAASWSPDGKQLVFSQVTDGNEDLYTCNSDGTNIVRLLESTSNESFPMWSPNGDLIMFEQFMISNGEKDINSYEILVLNIKTGKLKALTQNSYLDSGARWSPDGTKIAFLSASNGIDDFEISIMNADGSKVKQVTNTKEGSFATFPSWRKQRIQNTGAISVRTVPYTRSDKQFGQGRSFGFCKGDFNGDKLTDIFVTTYEGESGMYFKTDSGFSLSDIKFSSANENGHGVATGDLDRDGDLDLFLVNNSANSRVFYNDGGGNFIASNETYGHDDGYGLNVTLADLDGDQDLDGILSNYTRMAQIMFNDGLGHYTTSNFQTFKTETIKVLVDDFNQDGALDAYFVNQKRQDQIALNDGRGVFTLMPDQYGESVSWGGASSGDLNGDHYPDVVVANDELGASIWLNNRSGKLIRFGANLGRANNNAILEDLDQDSDLDLILTAEKQDIAIYLNDGQANFELLTTLKGSTGGNTALVHDFDGDGKLDILIGRMRGGNEVYYYE